jgi:hypothetical protein
MGVAWRNAAIAAGAGRWVEAVSSAYYSGYERRSLAASENQLGTYGYYGYGRCGGEGYSELLSELRQSR